MSTQTIDLQHAAEGLSETAKVKVLHYISFLRYEEEHIPNAETIAAMEELRSGGGKKFSSIEALMRDLHDENDD